MRIIKIKHLHDFWMLHPTAESALRQWAAECRRAQWRSFADVKLYARSADWVGNGRVVFNICGNRFRLVVAMGFRTGIVLVKFIGTHAEYEKVDVATVEMGGSR